MSPGGERPAGTDGADMFACACTCGYAKRLNRYVVSCPEADQHVPNVAYTFSCKLVGS